VRVCLPCLLAALLFAASARGEDLLLATTTSVSDTGLLERLVPRFEARSGVRVRTLAVGSGQALRLGADGNADVLVTHAPEGEEELVRQGKVLSREPCMENHFVIAGPPEDPAGVAKAASAALAMRAIAEARAPFASRADDSGTHQREQALLRAAGLDPDASWAGLVHTGAGMGLTLQVAGEKRAYVLSDLGTFLAFRERIGLVALSRPEPALRNVYSVLVVKPAGRAFAEFLLEEETQEAIGAFGRERFGEPLFRPLHPRAAAVRGGAVPGPGETAPATGSRAPTPIR
jgi:tungstate transport system substrate-binding protein